MRLQTSQRAGTWAMISIPRLGYVVHEGWWSVLTLTVVTGCRVQRSLVCGRNRARSYLVATLLLDSDVVQGRWSDARLH